MICRLTDLGRIHSAGILYKYSKAGRRLYSMQWIGMLHILPKLASLPIPAIFGLLSAAVFLSWLLYIIGQYLSLGIWNRRHVASWHSISSQLSEPWRQWICIYLPKLSPWIDISTLSQALVVIILIAANLVALTFHTNSWRTAKIRAGSLAIIHLIPLCLGINFGFPADLLHLDRKTFAWCHRWIGNICVLHSLLHGSLVAPTVTQARPAHRDTIITILVSRRCDSEPILHIKARH